MKDEKTPEWIIEQVLSYKLSKKDAINKIKSLIEDAQNEYIGYMGETERKSFIGIIKSYYKDYGYPIKGSMDDIKAYLNKALEQCGFSNFSEIKNTKENNRHIQDALYYLRVKILG